MEATGYGSVPHRPHIYHSASYSTPQTRTSAVMSGHPGYNVGLQRRNQSEPVVAPQRNPQNSAHGALLMYPSQRHRQSTTCTFSDTFMAFYSHSIKDYHDYSTQSPAEYGSDTLYHSSNRPAYGHHRGFAPLYPTEPSAPPIKSKRNRRLIGQDTSTPQEPKRPAFPFKFRRKTDSTANRDQATPSAPPLPASKGTQVESLPPRAQQADEADIKQGSAAEDVTRLGRQTMFWFKGLVRSSVQAKSKPSNEPAVLQKATPVEVAIPHKEAKSADKRDQRRRRDSRADPMPELRAEPVRDSNPRRPERRTSGRRDSEGDMSRRRESLQYQRRESEPAHGQGPPVESSRRRERRTSQTAPIAIEVKARDSQYGRPPARPRSRSRERGQDPRRSSRRDSTREEGYMSQDTREERRPRREELQPIAKIDPVQSAIQLSKPSSVVSNRERSHSVLEPERPITGDRSSNEESGAPSQRQRAPSIRSILKPPSSSASALRLPWEGGDSSHSGVERSYDPRHSEYRRRRSDSTRSTQRPPSSSGHHVYEPSTSVASKGSLRSHSPSTRQSTESGGHRAAEVKVNTKHNATNLAYQPHRDSTAVLQYGSVPVHPVYYSDQEHPRHRRRSSTSAARSEYAYADPYGHYSDYDRLDPRGHSRYPEYAYHGAEYVQNYHRPPREYSSASYGVAYPVYR